MFSSFSYTPTPLHPQQQHPQQPQQQSYQEPRSNTYSSQFELPDLPASTVSSLSFLDAPGLIASSFWSGEIKLWRMQQSSAVPVASFSLPEAVLALSSQSPQHLFAACSDGSISAYDLNQGAQKQVNREGAPVSHLEFLPAPGLLVSGSWGSELNFYDLRQQGPVQTLKAPGRVNGMGAHGGRVVFGTSARGLFSYTVGSSTAIEPIKLAASPSYYNTATAANTELGGSINSVAVLADGKTAAVGMSSGRVALVDLEGKGTEKELDCHENSKYYGKKEMYSANSVIAHGFAAVCCSSGGDGKSHFINRATKRVAFSVDAPSSGKSSYYASSKVNMSVVSSCFGDGYRVLVRAYGYDWSLGHKGANAENSKSRIFVNYSS